MKLVPLTRGKCAIVDDEDYERVMQYRWCFLHTGYAVRRAGRGLMLMHRFILDAPNEFEVDHVNHNKLDNSRANIRLCSRTNNRRNSRKRQDVLRTKYKCVVPVRRKNGRVKYWSYCNFNGRQIHLGTFDTEAEAARAYDKKAVEVFGEFACLNFPGSAATASSEF